MPGRTVITGFSFDAANPLTIDGIARRLTARPDLRRPADRLHLQRKFVLRVAPVRAHDVAEIQFEARVRQKVGR